MFLFVRGTFCARRAPFERLQEPSGLGPFEFFCERGESEGSLLNAQQYCEGFGAKHCARPVIMTEKADPRLGDDGKLLHRFGISAPEGGRLP